MARSHFSSKCGFILATAASAIGLGNSWRFPYIVGENGGGAFILLYILCLGLIGYFLLAFKLAFGRQVQTNFSNAFDVLGKMLKRPLSPFWKKAATFLIIGNIFLLVSVYVVVIGWTLFFCLASVMKAFVFSTSVPASELFEANLSSFSQQFFWSTVCILFAAFVVSRGVKNGIEKTSLFMMPLLFGLLFLMLGRVLFLPNIQKGLSFFFLPDWQKIGFLASGFDLKVFSTALIRAMGQAFYSLSLGMGVVIVYGSYLPSKENIKVNAGYIVGLDLLVSLLSGMIVIPAVFAFNLEVSSGPSLTFITLPLVFEEIWVGSFFAILFFFLLFLAAITSFISMYEPITDYITAKFKLSRKKSAFTFALINFVGMGIILLSYTGLLDIKILNRNLFDLFDWITGTFSLSMTLVVSSLFMGWIGFDLIWDNLNMNSPSKSPVLKIYLKFLLKWLAPILFTALIVFEWKNN